MNAPIPLHLLAPQTPNLIEIFGGGPAFRGDISNEQYHADRSCVSVTGLKTILRTPEHFLTYLNGKRTETPTLFFGRALHTRVLEPEKFNDQYVLEPENAPTRPTSRQRNAKKPSQESIEAIAFWDQFEAENNGKEIITREMLHQLDCMAEAAFRHTSASTLLKAGWKEHTLIWQDEETGIWVKIRPDNLFMDANIRVCLDLKSTEDASKPAFGRSCVNYDYDLQAAAYKTGLQKFFGSEFDFAFLPMEKEAPYGVALYGAPKNMIERGMRRFREALNRLKACRESGIWPSYQPDGGYEMLDWPSYAK